MDRQYKHLNSEERGVIFAENRWGPACGRLDRFWGDRQVL